MAQLESIVLENFQSIRDRTTIPIRPLTLLYGPNSAGKSVIYDAFRLLEATFGNQADRSEVDQLASRWAHKNPASDEEVGIKIEVVLRDVFLGSFPLFLHNIPDDVFSDEKSVLSGPRTIKLVIEYACDGDDPSEFSIEILSGAQKILEFSNYNLWLNFECFGDALYYALPGGERVNFATEARYLWGDRCFFIYTSNDRDEIDETREASASIISKLSAHILDATVRCIKFPVLVAADRGIIEAAEMTALANAEISANVDNSKCFIWGVGFCSRGIPWWYSNSESMMPINRHPGKLGVIEEIAQSRLDYLLLERARELYSEFQNGKLDGQLVGEGVGASFSQLEGKILSFREGESSESLVDFVNRSLGFSLFIDKGYGIIFDACEVRPPKTVDDEILSSKYLGGDASGLKISEGVEVCISALLVCSLVDNSSRKLTFEDVGTGLSCLIPVLVGLYSKCSFVQQPELHLHPALQSAMGDVCIEAARRGDDATHFIETHSEHLLLRILKRVRQASAGRIASTDALAVKPDDLAILYFDPQPDGSTKVKRIRVTDDGDFLDRWPRGFFEERGKELFDE
jgi:hypothetical protein